MTTSDLIMKSIENLILYGIDIEIEEDDSNEYLFQMEKYFNDSSEDMVATLDIDRLIIDTISNDLIATLYIKDGVLHIIPTTNENSFNCIVLMLEFVSNNTEMFVKNTNPKEEEDSDDDFDWI
jgi:hypothetical protein